MHVLVYAHLGALINIEELHYRLESGSMPDCVLPRLRFLIYGPPYSASTTAFLVNHPHIEGLHFLAGTIVPHATCGVGSLKMHALTSFIGPGAVLEALELDSCLNDALIRWPDDAEGRDYEAALRALRPSAQRICRLSCSQSLWDIRLFPVIAKYLPTLPNIRFHVLISNQGVRVLLMC